MRLPHGRRTARRPGIILLEVVVALGVLMMGLVFCGAAIRTSWQNAERSEEMARAMMLTEGLLAQLDTGNYQPEREQTGVFGPEAKGALTWTLEIVPDAREPDLLLVTARVFEGPADAPEGGNRLLLESHAIRPKPRPLSLTNDFGLTEEQTKLLTDAIPGGSQVLDPENFDPTSLARMNMDQLVELLPTLMTLMSGQMGGGGDMASLDPSKLAGALQGAGGATGGGGHGAPGSPTGSGSTGATRGGARGSGSTGNSTRGGGT